VREGAISRGRKIWQFKEGHEGNIEQEDKALLKFVPI